MYIYIYIYIHIYIYIYIYIYIQSFEDGTFEAVRDKASLDSVLVIKKFL